MTVTASSPLHERSRRAIAAHFAGRTSTVTEASMRTHLLTCAACKDLYQRHLTLAQIDPRALPPADRIARGLGFRARASRRGRRPTRLFAGLAVPFAIAATLVVLTTNRIRDMRTHAGDEGFIARSTGAGGGRTAAFWTYRIGLNGVPRLADQAIVSGEELAFAYSNPAGKPFLMIFGVDEHRHVYWFHPAWPVGFPAPTAVRASAGPGPHELPNAIRHSLNGRRLTVYAAFSERALDANEVEAAIRAAPTTDSLPALDGGVLVFGRTYGVQR